MAWNILIIDDDEDEFILAREMLNEAKGHRFDVHWAATYEAGIAQLFSNHYNAALVDYDMGLHSGIELIREANERGYSSPLILFTGRGNYEVDVEAMQAGATLYLTKNEANALLLERAIRYAIEIKSKETELREARETAERELAQRKRAEESLKESTEALLASERKFSTLFQKAAYAAILGSLPDSTIVDVNEAWEKLYGYTRTEAIGKTIPELNLVVYPEQRPRYLAELMQKGFVHDFELLIRVKTGEVRTMRVNFDVLEIGGKQYTLNTSYDITAIKEAETALRQSEEKYAKSFRSSPAAIAISTVAEGRFTEVNERFSEIFGYSREEMIGHTSIGLGLYSNPAERNEILRLLKEEGRFRDYEIRLLNRKGEPRDLLFSGERIEMEGQGYLLALILDITERKQAEQALKESQARLVEFVENIHNNYIALDHDWRFTYANQHYGKVMGVDPQTLIGKNYWELFPQYLGTELEQNYRKVMTEKVPLHYTQGGIYTNNMYEVSLFPTKEGIAVFSIDRSEEGRQRQRLENERARWQGVVEGIADEVWYCDTQGRMSLINLPDVTAMGLKEFKDWPYEKVLEEVEILNPDGMIRPMDQAPLLRALKGTIVRGEEIMRQRDTGKIRYRQYSAAPTRDESGQITGSVAIVHDITPLKQTETALRKSEEKFSKSFHTSPVSLTLTGLADGRYLEVNESFYRLTGYTREEIIGNTVYEIGLYVDPDKRVEMTKLVKTQGSLRDYEINIYTKSRAIRTILTSIEPIEITGEACILTTFIDITERKQIEQALRENGAMLRDFLENNPESFFILDRDWHFQYINRRFAEILQTTPEELLGKTFWEAYPGYLGTPVEQHYRRAMEDRAPVHFEMHGVYSQYWFDISAYPTQEGIGIFAVDRSAEKKAKEDLQSAYARLRFFIDANIVGVTMHQEDGLLLEANDYYLNLIGHSREDLEAGGLNWRSFTVAEYLPLDDQSIAVLKAGEVSPAYEKEYIRKDGSRVWVMINRALLPDGTFAAFVYDISERKRAEEALAETAEKLARSNQELEEFAFVASHDLQEPLRKVIMFGTRVRDHLCDTPDETVTDYLNRMQDAARRMQAMINGLLELSRVNRRGGEFVALNLNQVVAEVVDDLEARIRSVNGQVLFESLPSIHGDEVQIRELFLNLIGNALKFHKPDVPPVVRVSGKLEWSRRPAIAQIWIEDNGIGFEQENAERIFQPFQRLHGRSEYEGTGLGLSICQKIVERHHGTIEVKSVPGEGTTFSIRLPLEQH